MKFYLTRTDDIAGTVLSTYPKVKPFFVEYEEDGYGGIPVIELNSLEDLERIIDLTHKDIVVFRGYDGKLMFDEQGNPRYNFNDKLTIEIYDDYRE